MSDLSIEELRGLIAEGEVVDPLVFLESVMTGSDPREKSKLGIFVNDLVEFYGEDGLPSIEDWKEVVALVKGNYLYKEVSVSQSISAAKNLAEYLHPKRKNVEITGDAMGNSVKNNPLTEADIKLFREKYDASF